MALQSPLTIQPYDYIGDSTGRPLDKGMIYIGVAGLDPEFNQIPVFLDEALTLPIDQPIRTNDGFVEFAGDLRELYASADVYSLKILDKQGRKVIYKAEMMRDNLTDDALSSLNAAIAEAQAQAVITTTEIVNETIDDIMIGEYQAELETKVDGLSVDVAAQKLDTGITVTAKNGGVERKLNLKLEDTVSVKDFGAIGVYPSDDTTAIEFADAYCHENGKMLYFPDGQYGISRSITKQAAWKGTTAPRLMPFPQKDDDKIYLAPNKKSDMVGSSIFILPNFTASTITTQRSDMFSTLNYAVKTHERYPSPIADLAIIMDMNVFDASGNLTTPANDERVEVDVGYLKDDSSANTNHNLTVFGYFNKAGTAIWAHGVGDNPDYNKFFGGSTMGYYGLALLGNDTAVGNGVGLSGSQFYGFQLFGNDHHSRQPQVLKSYQTNKYGHILFIDGNTTAADANINGHEFFGGGWRSYSNRPVILNHCSNLHLTNVPMEFSQVSGQPDTTGCKFIGTAQTMNVSIINSRNFVTGMVAHAEFGDIAEKITMTSDFYGGFIVGNKGAYVRMMPTGGGLDPRIQFTRNLASSEDGWTLRMDVDNADKMQLKSNGNTVWEATGADVLHSGRISGRLNMRDYTATISSSAITIPNYASYIVLASGGVPVDLHTINGTFEKGDLLVLTAGSNSTVVTLKHTGGNIRLSGKADIVLEGSQDKIQMIYDGSNFIGSSLWDVG